jgi:FkbM family methyltransferase
MRDILKKFRRKTGVILRGGLQPVLDRRRLHKMHRDRFSQEAIKNEGYYSQNGQDKWAAEVIFDGRRNGFFLEIGAYNGLDLSNTCYLERKLGWAGICVEPVPSLYAALSRNRKCVCVQGCVTAKDGEVEFLEVEGCETLSTLANSLGEAEDERVAGHKINRLKLPGLALNTLLRRHQVPKVDFMSIDTEGSEMEILKKFDWGAVPITAICIENIYFGDLLAEFLYERGYRLDAILGSDEIYVHRSSHLARSNGDQI